MSSGPEPPADDPRLRWLKRAAYLMALLAFAGGAVKLLRHYENKPPKMNGDGWEYINQIESLDAHASPELRPEDLLAVDAKSVKEGWGPAPRPPYAYHHSPDGRLYSVHFWGCSLATVPAKRYLRSNGGNELSAMQLTNAVLFVLAMFVVLFLWPATVWKRIAYAALVTVGPVLWYIGFTGTEIFSWAFAVMAIVAYDSRKYVLCSAAAAVAAMQNPTLVFFCGAAVAMSIWERRWWQATLSFVAATISFIPAVFFKMHFDTPSLIAKGFVSRTYISWAKTWGYAFDFNQGLVTFAPLLVLGAIIGSLLLIARRSVPGVVMIGTMAAVAVATEVQVNWNSGCVGCLRYLVWMIPGVAWLMLAGLGSGWAAKLFTVAAVAASGAMAHVAPFEGGYLSHNPVAKWVLINYPRLYYPDPEVFVERIQETETPWPRDYATAVGFAAPDGSVTKIIVDSANVDAVAAAYQATPEYMEALRAQAAGRTGHFYAHPPRGAVRKR